MQEFHKRPGVGVALIVHKSDEILLTHRINAHGAGTWAPPGGHLEYGESPEECAIRETLEETQIVVANVRFKAVTNDVFVDEGLHYLTIWMDGDYVSGEPVRQEEECSEVGWFRWDALPEKLFLPLRNLLNGQNCYG